MKYFFALFIAYALFSCSPAFVPVKIENGRLFGVVPMQYDRATYQMVERVAANREQIFRQARKWGAFHLPNPTTAFSASDNQLGDIITPAIVQGEYVRRKGEAFTLPTVNFSAAIECQDNYYRVTFTNVKLTQGLLIYGIEVRPSGISENTARKQLAEINTRIQSFLEDLRQFVTSEAKPLN